MTKRYRPWLPEQTYLLPPSPTEWLPEGHLAYFVLEIVGELDLGAIEEVIHKKDPRGERPYSPEMMTSLILYAYCTGTFSSRKIERATYEDVALRVIAGGTHPHWTTINSFRLAHRAALAGLFTQVLKMCARSGLKALGHVALDGSKVQANASKHKAMSYGRMKEDEKRLAAEIEALLKRAEDVDAKEDAEFGDARGDELPEELRHRETRLRRIREVKAELEKEAAEARAATLRENAAALREKAADSTVPRASERRLRRSRGSPRNRRTGSRHEMTTMMTTALRAASSCRCITCRQHRMASRRTRRNATSPMRTAESCSVTVSSCRPTTRKRPSPKIRSSSRTASRTIPLMLCSWRRCWSACAASEDRHR